MGRGGDFVAFCPKRGGAWCVCVCMGVVGVWGVCVGGGGCRLEVGTR